MKIYLFYLLARFCLFGCVESSEIVVVRVDPIELMHEESHGYSGSAWSEFNRCKKGLEGMRKTTGGETEKKNCPFDAGKEVLEALVGAVSRKKEKTPLPLSSSPESREKAKRAAAAVSSAAQPGEKQKTANQEAESEGTVGTVSLLRASAPPCTPAASSSTTPLYMVMIFTGLNPNWDDQQQADMGDAVRFDKLEQIGKVKRVTTVFIPGKTNGQVWYATFKAKADAGNLNVNEKKLLLVGHFEDPDLILWWNENSASATTSDKVNTLFLKAYGSTGVTQAHAVYGIADVRLNLGDDHNKFVERFVDVYIQANPNRRRNNRISSFINVLYPELREELEIEQIYTDWDQLKRRVGYFHAKQQKKARA
uniref:Uncharacterized protein n=1 Tax=Chromera velia CCMP2878 TaxID=1169474 RepID=A0A0G4HPB4_9ALVE|eukprot:Cvel_7781.t1-p1 / transcript=Cvel_7781.t1 / gene=Cvel_7781 / organism=Chromera_velia_CCMP2878 / gene_product=hypothetical protein / transcript_product=hypothetical protein / location=Cvel_scaffold414:78122-82271(-) / protein_length=365 / sequence_SO=supercontig / SO=protein_coding / is_pseudo=false